MAPHRSIGTSTIRERQYFGAAHTDEDQMTSEASVALTIPDLSVGNIPVGCATYEFAPLVEEADWEKLNDIEGRLRALASWIESYKGDALEIEKALRLVEYRRGMLLGPRQPGRREEEPLTRMLEVEASEMTVSRWRKIADNWVSIVWPYLMDATHRSEVTQAEILRLIDRKLGNVATPVDYAHVIPDQNATPVVAHSEIPPQIFSEVPQEFPVDLVAEHARAEEENERLRGLLEVLTSSRDIAEDYAVMVTRYAQLEGRLQQEMTSRAEAVAETKYAKNMLSKIRETLAVDADRDIIPEILALQQAFADSRSF